MTQDMESTMKYLLLIYGNEANMLSASKATTDQMHAAYGAYTEAMKKAGVIVGGERLRPTSSARCPTPTYSARSTTRPATGTGGRPNTSTWSQTR